MHIQTINARLTNRRTLSRVIFYYRIMSNTFKPDMHYIVIRLLLISHDKHIQNTNKFVRLVNRRIIYRVSWFYQIFYTFLHWYTNIFHHANRFRGVFILNIAYIQRKIYQTTNVYFRFYSDWQFLTTVLLYTLFLL